MIKMGSILFLSGYNKYSSLGFIVGKLKVATLADANLRGTEPKCQKWTRAAAWTRLLRDTR